MYGPGVLKAGQNTGVGTTAAPLGEEDCLSVFFEAAAGNGADILVGDSVLQLIPRAPCQAISMDISNINQIFVKSVSGTQIVNWLVEK